MTRRVVPVGARLILGAIFGLSAISKISAPGLFRADVAAYQILPGSIVDPFALALPWIEALLAVYLFVGLLLRPAAIVAAGLLVTFGIALTSNVISGNTVHSCGCLPVTGFWGSIPMLVWLFGGTTIGLVDVARDLALTALALIIYRGDRSLLSLDAWLFGADDIGSESHTISGS